MFAWLTRSSRAMCRRTGVSDRSLCRCFVPMTGAELAQRLPWLGSVLYLQAPLRGGYDASSHLPTGWLVERPELAPLLATTQLILSSQIGADGPREWIDGFDAQGQLLASLHLLPDTDYLAWDALLADGYCLPAAWLRGERRRQHAGHAEILQFQVRRMGGLQLLESAPATQLSRLGRVVAGDVARTWSVDLAPAPG
ncbi:hypothetical protein DVT68_05515 [Dyella solisilvae]|uniref:Uncharacterized protein n=2 Tax=Dyella solisilvae TaxID=1920168 RepID=A0A370KCB2_9GAMM|nr:hypothetical protein DVT68_05515 [Dyella solisilvae]